MRCTLQVSFNMDDLNPEVEEMIEDIRREVQDTISNYSDTWKPKVKIWDEDQ